MSHLDQSLDAALLLNDPAVNAVAAGNAGSGVGVLGSLKGALLRELPVRSLLCLIVRLLPPRKHRA